MTTGRGEWGRRVGDRGLGGALGWADGGELDAYM